MSRFFAKINDAKMRPIYSAAYAGDNVYFTAINHSKFVFHDRLLSWAKQKVGCDCSNDSRSMATVKVDQNLKA
jgi:hypothetical protein